MKAQCKSQLSLTDPQFTVTRVQGPQCILFTRVMARKCLRLLRRLTQKETASFTKQGCRLIRVAHQTHDGDPGHKGALSDPGGEQKNIQMALTSQLSRSPRMEHLHGVHSPYEGARWPGKVKLIETLLRLRRFLVPTVLKEMKLFPSRLDLKIRCDRPKQATSFASSHFPLPHSPARRSPNLSYNRVQTSHSRRATLALSPS